MQASTRRVPAFPAMLAVALAVAALAGAVRYLGTFLVVSDAPVTADVALITYGVNSFARPTARAGALREVAARYGDGEVGTVVISELVAFAGAFSTRVDLSRATLAKAGIPDHSIEVLPAVESEREEALAFAAMLELHGWSRAVAYAPDFRSRRTRGALRRAAANVDIRVISVPDLTVDLNRWWLSADAAQAVLNEYPRLLYYVARRWV